MYSPPPKGAGRAVEIHEAPHLVLTVLPEENPDYSKTAFQESSINATRDGHFEERKLLLKP